MAQANVVLFIRRTSYVVSPGVKTEFWLPLTHCQGNIVHKERLQVWIGTPNSELFGFASLEARGEECVLGVIRI